MTSPVSYASCEVPCPPYELEFDPYDRGYLLVTGGGGESRSGVPNRLTLVDTSSRAVIEPVGSFDLPTTDELPTSTSSLTTPNGLRIFTAQSEGKSNRLQGQNDHIKTVDLAFPTFTKAKEARLEEDEKKGANTEAYFSKAGQTRLLSQKAVTGKYAVQESMRLSPAGPREQKTNRVLAIASKDGEKSEIAIVDATRATLDESCVLERIDLGSDAEDLDVNSTSDEDFSVAWVTSDAVYAKSFSYAFTPGSYKPEETIEVYKTPSTAHRNMKQVRWLSGDAVLVLSGLIAGRTSEFMVCHLDKNVSQLVSLPRFLRMCTAMDIARLDADPSGVRQIVVAVGGAEGSIAISHITLDENKPPAEQISKIKRYTTLKDVHDNSLCKVAFSSFYPPRESKTSPSTMAVSTQYLKLASCAIMSKKVVVESIALTSTPTKPSLSGEIRDRPQHPSIRWVLSSASTETISHYASYLIAALAILITALIYQNYSALASGDVMAPLRLMPFKDYNAPGAVPPAARTPRNPNSVMDKASAKVDVAAGGSATAEADAGVKAVKEAVEKAEQAIPSDASPGDAKATSLADLVAEHGTGESGPGADESSGVKNVILVSPHEDEDRASVLVKEAGHASLEGAKRFGDLATEEQAVWRERLVKAGHWAEEQGIKVLEGVLFSEYAADVGGALRDAVMN